MNILSIKHQALDSRHGIGMIGVKKLFSGCTQNLFSHVQLDVPAIMCMSQLGYRLTGVLNKNYVGMAKI